MTIDAFWYRQLNEPDRLEAWLVDHPRVSRRYALLQARKMKKIIPGHIVQSAERLSKAGHG
jgi:hypothetical protein